MTFLIILAVFIGVATLVGGVALMFRGESQSTAEARLGMLTGAVHAPGREGGEKQQSLLAQPLDDVPGMLESFVSRFGNLRQFLEQADVNMGPPKFFLITGAVGGAATLLFALVTGQFLLAPVVGILAALLPLGYVWFKRKRRLAHFAKQLPEALELIARALRAGHSLGAGLHLAATETGGPLGKEFTRCYEEQNLGVPLEEALEEMTFRVPNLDLRFFVTAVVLQRQTGGDLAEILDKIGYIIRERFKIWGQIQALTGEGRLSGAVLLGLPPFLFIAIWRLNPDYVMVLFTDPLGNQMLAAAAVMQFLGALVIRKIINIKV